jgi:uncharacterized protein
MLTCLPAGRNKFSMTIAYMRFIFIPILLIFISVIFGGHYLVYYTIIKFFNVADGQIKTIFLYITIALSFSLLVSMVLAHFSNSAIVRWFYIVISTWHGFLVNLFLASILCWLTYTVAKYANINLNFKIILSVLFLLAIAISIYGIWNAQHPQLKNITVKIKNLPPQWQNEKIIFISDIHLGAVNKAPFIKKVVEQINTVKPELVLIGGDYFDGSLSEYNSLTDPLKNIKSKFGVYFVNGNHESYIGELGADKALQSAGVKILKDEIADIDGLNIVGADFTNDLGNKQSIEALLKKVSFDETNIFMYHEPRYTDLAKTSGVDLQLAGHAHYGQQFPFQFFTWLVYKKYFYGLHVEGAYTSYTSNGVGTWGPPIRIGNTPEIVIITLN